MRLWAGWVPEISVSGLEILPWYEQFSPLNRMKVGWILAVRMALSCISCYIFHIISIPFNCTDTALRVPKATRMIGAKFKIFVFHHGCFVSRQIWCQNSYPGSLAFSHLRNWAEIAQMKPRPISSTTGQASSASHTHVKRPKVNWWVRHTTHRCLGQANVEKLPGKYHYKNELGTGG